MYAIYLLNEVEEFLEIRGQDNTALYPGTTGTQ